MGYYQAMAPCWSCGALFTFNPLTVPSFNGEPICESCITATNERRRAAGRALWPVAADAYEPAEEGQL
jgi:hypothetical protein